METFKALEACKRLVAGKKIRQVEWDRGEFVCFNSEGFLVFMNRDNNLGVMKLDDRCTYEENTEPREEIDFYEMVRQIMDNPDKQFKSDKYTSKVGMCYGALTWLGGDEPVKLSGNVVIDDLIIRSTWYEA